MRGEINNDTFDERRNVCIDECCKADDDSAAQVGFLLWFFYDDLVTHHISQSREGWDALRRYAAFLKTDFELERVCRRQWQNLQWLAFGGLPLLAAGWFMMSQTGSWVPLVVPWVLVSIAWVVMRRAQPRNDEVEKMWQFAPFWSEAHWRQYEPLADATGIPDYDPDTHAHPYRSVASERRIWIQNTCAGIALLPLVLLWHCFPIKFEVYRIPPHEKAGCVSAGCDRAASSSGAFDASTN